MDWISFSHSMTSRREVSISSAADFPDVNDGMVCACLGLKRIEEIVDTAD